MHRSAVEIGNHFERQPSDRAAQSGAHRRRVTDLFGGNGDYADVCRDADDLGVDAFFTEKSSRIGDLRRDEAQRKARHADAHFLQGLCQSKLCADQCQAED